jgi:hypothetical protein
MTPTIGLLVLLLAPVESVLVRPAGTGVVWAVGINGQAVGWALAKPHHEVTIAARLGNGGGRAYLDAYLMTSIGPGTTEAHEIARTSLDLPYPHDGWVDLFTGLDLEPGTYWLVIARPRERAHSSINWFVEKPGDFDWSCHVRYLESRSYTFHSDAAEYIPASKFEKKYEPYRFQFAVHGVTDEECP